MFVLLLEKGHGGVGGILTATGFFAFGALDIYALDKVYEQVAELVHAAEDEAIRSATLRENLRYPSVLIEAEKGYHFSIIGN